MTAMQPRAARPRRSRHTYTVWFLVPAAVIYTAMFLVPTVASFFFSLTRWTLFNATFIGLDNFLQFVHEPFLIKGVVNTLIYAALTSSMKVVIGLALGALLTSGIFGRGLIRSLVFFPVLVSTIGVGITFTALLHPTAGVINRTLGAIGLPEPGWLTDPRFALLSVALVDVWKGVGLATVIYMAGIVSIPRELHEAARMDGASTLRRFWNVTVPLAWPATYTVILLSLIGGLRSFDLIWTMTRGGPGFTSDVIASVIYKQYQAGFYGLSTAGNVILFAMVALVVMPLMLVLDRRRVAA